MKKNIILAFLASVVLCSSLVSAPAMAGVKSFCTIDDIEAQVLTAIEMGTLLVEGRRPDALTAYL